MGNKFISIDPGMLGCLTIWEDIKPIKTIKYGRKSDNKKEYTCYNDKWKQCFIENKGIKIELEYIATCFAGAFASFILGKNIGEIKGLAHGLCEIEEKGNTPNEWKVRIDKELELNQDECLKKPMKVKWQKDEAKKRSVNLCKRLFPEIDIKVYNDDGTPKIVKHKDKSEEQIYDDNIADSILIGLSYLIKNGKIKIENEKLIKI